MTTRPHDHTATGPHDHTTTRSHTRAHSAVFLVVALTHLLALAQVLVSFAVIRAISAPKLRIRHEDARLQQMLAHLTVHKVPCWHLRVTCGQNGFSIAPWSECVPSSGFRFPASVQQQQKQERVREYQSDTLERKSDTRHKLKLGAHRRVAVSPMT